MNYRIRNIPAAVADPVFDTPQLPHSRVVRASFVPTSILRYTYYAFIFSLPLEKADIVIEGFPLSRILGFILVAVTIAFAVLHKPRFRFEPPPKAFWCFAIYVAVYAALGLNTIVSVGPEAGLTEQIIQEGKTLVQLLIFFWISCNLMRYERIIKGFLLTLAASCIFIAILQSLGMTGDIATQDRIAAFDANENLIAFVLSIGLLIVVGLVYGRIKSDLKTRLLFWLCSGTLAVMIVVTGSRGATIALFLALLAFFLHGKSLKFKLKMGLVVILVMGLLVWLSNEVEPVRERWERTYYEGDTAGRDLIYSAAWEMFLEKPVAGWGPANHLFELGSRLGLRTSRDPHNNYLWLLAETGLLGTVPFLVGLWLCLLAAWKARKSTQGALPMSLLIFILVTGMKGTNSFEKLFWVVLSYAIAASSSVVGQRDQADRANPSSRLVKSPFQSI